MDDAAGFYSFTSFSIYKSGTSIGTRGTTGNWAAVKYNAFNDTTEQVFAVNGAVRIRIDDETINNWGIDAPSEAPTIAVGAGTGLTGDYNAQYTYVRKVDATVVAESNPSPAADAAVTLANESLSVTWTASTDPQVSHVRVYRTLTGGTTYFFDQEIAIGTTTVDTSTADTALGAQVETDHDRPPSGNLAGGPFYNGVVFIADSNRLYYCKPKQPEYWPSNNFIEIGSRQDPLVSIAEFAGQAYVASQQRLWFVQGTGTSSFFPVPLSTMTGAQGRFGTIGVEGHGIFHTGKDGVYLFGGGRDRKFSESRFDPIFRGETAGDVPAVQDIEAAWLAQVGNRLFFHYDDGNVIVFNLDNAKSYYYKYDEALYAPLLEPTLQKLIVGDQSRFARVLESGDDDAGTAISWLARSKDFTLQTRAHFPRWIKYDTEGTMTGALLLDGVVHQTHALTESRNTRRRLIDTENGIRCALQLSGTSDATIYALEME